MSQYTNRAQRRQLAHQQRRGKTHPQENQKKMYWEELDAMYSQCMAALVVVQIPRYLMSRKDLLEKVEDPRLLADKLNEINRDTRDIQENLNATQAMHADRQGEVTDFADYDLLMDINNRYDEAYHKLYGLVMPNISEVARLFGYSLQDAATLSQQDLPQDVQTDYGHYQQPNGCH